ncbi:hypothetical protein OIU78_017434 [Salix suchowensis]|nr:hypothetical protein OIU78_017434 [Salix suchowensis]KAJ6313787.1 hypothetical protein OIU78_017434 [Salix suchowensis]
MDSSGAHNYRSDRVRDTISSMEHGSIRMDCRTFSHVVLCFSRPCFYFSLPAIAIDLLILNLGPTRNRSFLEAVHETLGERNGFISSILTKISFYGTGIAYTVTTAISLRAIQKSNSYHKDGYEAEQGGASTLFMLLFGAVQVVLSQIPDFHHILWLSIFAAIMSVSYASIGSVLGFAQIIENGYVKGGIAGVSADSAADKVWKISQALGDIAYAYPYTLIALEIQDTLKSPPSENKTMKKASIIAFIATTFFLPLFWKLWLCSFWRKHAREPLDGVSFFRIILAC